MELLGRVAFLVSAASHVTERKWHLISCSQRHTLVQYEENKINISQKFWSYVDAELITIRAKHSDDAKKISKYVAFPPMQQLSYG